jgi:glycosyltransferase involved in cell wall biosynthesis
MTCGRPVVAAAGGALPEVLGAPRPCGTLVPPDSPGAVADAVRWLIDRPGEAAQQGLAARERARTHFTVGAMEEAYARLVERHVAATRRRT